MKQTLTIALIAILALFSAPRSFAQQATPDDQPFVQDQANSGQTKGPGEDENPPKEADTAQGAGTGATGLCAVCIAKTNQDILNATTAAQANQAYKATKGSTTSGDQ